MLYSKTYCFLFFFCLASSVIAQLGFEGAYVYGPKKEAFAGRLYIGNDDGNWGLGFGYEQGRFNSRPTSRLLDYYSLKLGIDGNPFFDWSYIETDNMICPYLGMDFEYLKTTKIIDRYRVSIYPKVGVRFLKVLFAEVTPDNLNEPETEGRFFKFNYNSYRVLMGLHYYIGR